MDDTAARSRRARRRIAFVLLAVYAVAVVLIAFWPVPVDSGAAGLLARIARWLPWATHSRLEIGANVVFFVPLGLLLSITLDRSRYLVLPIGLLTTIAIESLQAELLDQRTASITDILANTAGTCVGMLIAALFTRPRRGETD
ncbi:VanZ family protein [Microbacterium sp. P07]|uniref:VanZ family protein n=1 Tax=Microbacterium sp. P07 TaxID=3366952 RepID=UPI0037452401